MISLSGAFGCSRVKKNTIFAAQTFDRTKRNSLLVRGSSELQDRDPEAATERHGGDLVVPVRVGHAGVAEAREVVAAAARGRRHAPAREALLVPVAAATEIYSLFLAIL